MQKWFVVVAHFIGFFFCVHNFAPTFCRCATFALFSADLLFYVPTNFSFRIRLSTRALRLHYHILLIIAKHFYCVVIVIFASYAFVSRIFLIWPLCQSTTMYIGTCCAAALLRTSLVWALFSTGCVHLARKWSMRSGDARQICTYKNVYLSIDICI